MHYHTLRLIALIFVASCFAVTSNADDLENGSFETGDLSGWVDSSGVVGAPGVGAEGGSSAVLIESPNGVGELNQAFPASAGEEYRFTGYMLSENGLPGGTFGLIKIVFRDANGVDLDPASVSAGVQSPPNAPGIDSAPFLDDASAANTWTFTEAQGVAPTGTVEVIFLMLNVDFGGGNNPVWFDTLSANLIGGSELLVNGDLETGDLTGWVGIGSTPSQMVGAPAVGAQSGSSAIRLELSAGVAEVRQSFPATPGEEYYMSGYMLTENALPSGPTFGLFKVVFQDANGVDLVPASVTVGADAGTDFPGVDSRPTLNDTTPIDTWIFSEAGGVAPAGTVQVVYLLLNVDFAGGSNPMWFDSVIGCELGAGGVEPPSAFTVFRGIALSGGLADVVDSDDQRFLMNPGFTLNDTEAPAWLIFDATLASDAPSSLMFDRESQAGTPGLTATTEAFNYTTGVFDVLDATPEIFNVDTVVSVDLTAGAADFVEPGTGDIRARVGWRQTGFTLNFPWEVRVDHVFWTFN